MGGLDGNARIRMTPQMAGERRASAVISKEEVDEQLEKSRGNEIA